MACRPRLMRTLGERIDQVIRMPWVSSVVKRLFFFHLICIGWIFFRAESYDHASTILGTLSELGSIDWSVWLAQVKSSGQGGWLVIVALMTGSVLAFQFVYPTNSARMVARVWTTPEPIRFLGVVILLYLCLVSAPEAPPAFIYFQF